MRQVWAESAVKRKHDHRLQMRALNAEDIIDNADNPDVPGDINIKGDEYHTNEAGPGSTTGPLGLLGPLLLGLLLGLGLPLCGIALMSWWNRPTPPAAQAPAGPTQDFKLGIQVHD